MHWSKKWYQLFEGKQQCFIINYEDIHAYQTNTHKLIYIDCFLEAIGLKRREEYQIPNIDHIKMMKKQDTRTNLEDKIINYQDFIRQIKDKGLYEDLE